MHPKQDKSMAYPVVVQIGYIDAFMDYFLPLKCPHKRNYPIFLNFRHSNSYKENEYYPSY